jgi:imidazole glycerol-phosphate synthase subunit HisH
LIVGIINYGMGNIGSLKSALHYLGVESKVIHDSEQVDNYDSIILPGVGAFDAAMKSLRSMNLDSAIFSYSKSNRPILGICLGMQIFAKKSEEGLMPGLGLVDGTVRNLKSYGCEGKIPHIGFNVVNSKSSKSSFISSMNNKDFYFVHSYGMVELQSVNNIAYTDYEGARFTAAFNINNIYGTQFHPEKSGDIGLNILQNYLEC